MCARCAEILTRNIPSVNKCISISRKRAKARQIFRPSVHLLPYERDSKKARVWFTAMSTCKARRLTAKTAQIATIRKREC